MVCQVGNGIMTDFSWRLSSSSESARPLRPQGLHRRHLLHREPAWDPQALRGNPRGEQVEEWRGNRRKCWATLECWSLSENRSQSILDAWYKGDVSIPIPPSIRKIGYRPNKGPTQRKDDCGESPGVLYGPGRVSLHLERGMMKGATPRPPCHCCV